MRIHPYRVLRERPRKSSGGSNAAQFEERCLAVVLFIAGAIGLTIGLSAPRAHGTELVLGALLVVLGGWTIRPRGTSNEGTERPTDPGD